MPLITINPNESNSRLDKFLCKKFDISFALAQKLLREKKIKVNNARVDSSYKIRTEDQIEIFADLKKRNQEFKQKPKISREKIEKFLSAIIYEDENLIAIDKPSGLAVQGGSGVEFSIDDILKATENYKSAQLVHRLDKDTSGVLLIAKNKNAAEFLTQSFKDKIIKKTYLALVNGIVKKREGEIKIPLLKKFVGKNEKVYPDPAGKAAETLYKRLKTFKDYSLLELQPLTGRTHQLRVHCKEIGHPIINDVKYGSVAVLRKDLCPRLCLHALKIEFTDLSGKKILIESKKPDFA